MFLKKNIFEYDIRKANISVGITFKIIDKEFYDRLLSLEKQNREVEFGLFLRDNPEKYQELKKGIERSVSYFKKINGINNNEVDEIASDAIWITRRVNKTKLNDYVEFVCKREATSMFQFRRLKFYYNSLNGTLFQRGLGNKVFALYDFISGAMQLGEYGNKKSLYHYLHKFKLQYVRKELSEEYYDSLINSVDNIEIINAIINDMI